MALTDALGGGDNDSFANRGNIGTLEDALGHTRNTSYSYILLPTAAQVQSGVLFGLQGTQYTGSYTGGAYAQTARPQYHLGIV